MSSARLCDAQTIVPNLASGHERSDGKLVHAALMSWKLPFAAGAVCMTASDLVRWETALDEGRFISKGSVDAMRSPTILSDGTKIDYGLGTRLGSLDGHPVVGHTGGGGGFNSVLYALPRDHVAIAVLINTGTGAATTISFASAIARFMLGIPEPRLPNDVAVPNEELDNLATGGRLDSDDGPVETFIVDGRLHFRIPGTKIEGPMTRLAPYRYAVDENTEVQMQMRNGKVTWGLVYLGGMMTDAKTHVP